MFEGLGFTRQSSNLELGFYSLSCIAAKGVVCCALVARLSAVIPVPDSLREVRELYLDQQTI